MLLGLVSNIFFHFRGGLWVYLWRGYGYTTGHNYNILQKTSNRYIYGEVMGIPMARYSKMMKGCDIGPYGGGGWHEGVQVYRRKTEDGKRIWEVIEGIWYCIHCDCIFWESDKAETAF